ncbi:unnamed protein product [Pleuronectes platessa]|uniref:Uncharacterized protein n=1 Tax=Pleuronectes platessa TaxID=8262 RepID=A0A9N7Z0V9_PLEPL|nr:unnamed protein product [Pleuronectes platessa]
MAYLHVCAAGSAHILRRTFCGAHPAAHISCSADVLTSCGAHLLLRRRVHISCIAHPAAHISCSADVLTSCGVHILRRASTAAQMCAHLLQRTSCGAHLLQRTSCGAHLLQHCADVRTSPASQM